MKLDDDYIDDDYIDDEPELSAWIVWGWLIATAVISGGYIWGMVLIIKAMA